MRYFLISPRDNGRCSPRPIASDTTNSRETTTADVAEVVGIERRTAEDHLRRAEKKMADGLIEYL